MAETMKQARLNLTVATHTKSGEEPSFDTEFLDLPYAQAKGLINKTRVIVPREPTDEMLLAGLKAAPTMMPEEPLNTRYVNLIYKAMIKDK